ncbi:hypothetical protein IFM89_015443, partial [Coptis chinensis]
SKILTCFFLLPFAIIGHAFKAGIYAENVPKGFLPAAGVLHHYDPVTISSTVFCGCSIIEQFELRQEWNKETVSACIIIQ